MREKLLKLKEKVERKYSTDTSAFVKNLSSRKLSLCEIEVLATGRGFNMTTTKPPPLKIVATLKEGITHLHQVIKKKSNKK